MEFIPVYFQGLLLIISFFSLVWLVSVVLKNASIVDIFWGLGFVAVSMFYFMVTPNFHFKKTMVFSLVILWGLRLSIYILSRNMGKPEDFRYQDFRNHYGEKRYWWISFFQVFLLQGILVWLISAPLLGIMISKENTFGIIDWLALFLWLLGFIFEAGGDYQMYRFKRNPQNKGKVLQTGFWKYTRHPNYFGDSMVWWGFALFSVSSGMYLPVLSAVLMNWLLLKVSGVSLLERSLKENKAGYKEYVNRTSAFFPRIPKKIDSV